MNSYRMAGLIWLVMISIFTVALVQPAFGQDSARKIIDIRIENRKIVSPMGAIRALEADVLELRWLSDEATQLHLHGYDKKLNLRPGKPGVMSFTAGATGRFPITSHGWGKHGRGHGHHALTHLEVYPR